MDELELMGNDAKAAQYRRNTAWAMYFALEWVLRDREELP